MHKEVKFDNSALYGKKAMKNYTWTKIKTPNWEPVSFAAVSPYKKELYLTGGWNPLINSLSSQFWKCDHHFNWQQILSSKSFNQRNGHTLTVFKDKFFIIGGFNYQYKFLEDVWTLDLTNPLSNWECVVPKAPWEGREGHQTIVFKGSLWIFGGKSITGVLHDVWKSKDGIKWEKLTRHAEWNGRCFHNIELFNNKLWLIAGSSSVENAYNDMYVSEDGIEWQLFGKKPPFKPRFGAGVAVYDDKIWLIGGSNADEREFYNDIWWFTEEEGWNILEIDIPWKARWMYNCFHKFGDSLIILCGGMRLPNRKYFAYTDGWKMEIKK